MLWLTFHVFCVILVKCYSGVTLWYVVYLCLSQVAQSEVKSSQVVEDLRRNVSLHLLLQDACRCAVSGKRSLDVRLLQDLSQLDPCFHIIWILLCNFL